MWLQTHMRRLKPGTTTGATADLLCQDPRVARSPMKEHQSQEITQLLLAWNSGDAQALDRLVPLVHDALHQIAHQRMARERPGHPLQTTALVNEAYLRLIDASRVRWQDRAHFFAVSAQLIAGRRAALSRSPGTGRRSARGVPHRCL
jgi:RNA polymerase sigma-70 factor (ECF subfamily)